MGLTEEISTLAMIYSALLIRVLYVLILSLATPRSQSRTGRISRVVRIVLSVLIGRTSRTGSRRAFEAAGHIFENGSSEQG
jgi:hypothetical protein